MRRDTRLQIDHFRIDRRQRLLFSSDSVVPLGPKVVETLIVLAESPGRLLGKEELLRTLWPDSFVEEGSLAKNVSMLRKAMGGGASDQRYIQTVPRRGYRFVGTVMEVEEDAEVGAIGARDGTVWSAEPARRALLDFYGRPAAAGVLLLAGLALGGLALRRHRSVGNAGTVGIAMLPVVNQTGDPSADYLADGFTESVIGQMSDVAGLRVIGSASSFRYKQDQKDPQAIGRSLGVEEVLQEQLRRVDGHLSLVVELDRVSDGSVLFSHEYLPDSVDLRPVEADLVHDVLRSSTPGGEAQSASSLRPHTKLPAAYDEYLRGEALTTGNSPAELHQAVAHYERAVALDPSFDLAWAQLAQARLLLGLYFDRPREQMPLARQDAEQALRLNGDLAVAHGTLGVISLVYDWNMAAADSELEPAEAARSALSSLSCTSHLLHVTGQSRRAKEMVEHMLSYNPQSASLISELGCVAYYSRDYDAAVTNYQHALESDPSSPVPYWGLAKSLTQLGRYQEAVRAVDLFSTRNGFTPPILTAEAGYAYARSGKKQEAASRIQQLLQSANTTYTDPYLVALIHLGGGERDETFRWLAKAAEERSPFLISTLSDPKWSDTLTDPRFEAIVAGMRRR